MPEAKRKVVVIGAGAAGVFTAHALERQAPGRFDITLLERSSRLGGHTKSMLVDDGGVVNVDCGAQFFSSGTQPEYLEMLHEEGFFEEPSPIFKKEVGVTIWDAENDELLFKVPTTLHEILMQLPTKGLDWLNFMVLTIAAVELYSREDWSLDFGHWLEGLDFVGTEAQTTRFKQDIARPFMYQFGLVPPGELDSLSAKFVVYYFVGSLPWDGDGLFTVYNSHIGLDGILRRLLEKVGIDVTLNAEVFEISEVGDGEGYRISTAPQGTLIEADEIVFANNPPRIMRMLPDAPALGPLRDVLSHLHYTYVPVRMQQDDPDYMPADASAWSASNIMRYGSASNPHTYGLSVWFGPLRSQRAGRHYFKSWGSPFLEPVLAHSFVEEMHELMTGTPNFVAKRDELMQKYQGVANLWFAGGWSVDYDCQNAALKSARLVAQGLIERDDALRGRHASAAERGRSGGSSTRAENTAPCTKEHPGLPAIVESLVAMVSAIAGEDLAGPLKRSCEHARGERTSP